MKTNFTFKKLMCCMVLLLFSFCASYAQTPPVLSYKALASNAIYKGDQLLASAGFVAQSVTAGTSETLDPTGFVRFIAATSQFFVYRATNTSGLAFAPTGNYTIEFRARIFEGSGSWRGMDFSLNDGVGKTKNSFYLSHYRLGEVTDDPTMYEFAVQKQFQVIRIAVERSAKKIHFYVNGIYLETKDLIDATAGDVTFFQFGKGHSTAAHTIDIDYIAIDQTGAYSADPVTPVILSDFSVVKQASGVKVNWTTSTEINNSHFILERSTDGIAFTELVNISAKGASKYSYVDEKPAKGNYYRLTQFDLDGVSEVFEPKFIRFDLGNEQVKVYPSYINSNEFLTLSNLPEGRYTVNLYSVTGQKVFNNTFNDSDGKINFNIGNLNTGNYIIKLNSEQFKWTSKVTVK